MARSPLDEYSAKRAFDITPEPAPAGVRQGSGPLLFVIQQHAARNLHYDLRLECDGVLKSWAVPKGPALDPSEKRLAMQTEDHPYAYGSFEGVIPPGQYGAGSVIVWDCGPYSPDEGGTAFQDRAEAERRVREGLEKGKLGFELRGEKVKGSFALVRTKQAKQWLLIKHRDRFVTAEDVTVRDRSVLIGARVEDLDVVPAHRIEAAALAPSGAVVKMPAKVAPMVAETGNEAFHREGWMWEPKLDGRRALVHIDASGAAIRSPEGLGLSAQFPALAKELARQGPHAMILDGELVAFDARGIAPVDESVPVVFCAFDLLHFAGVDLRAAPYRDRRRYLAQCLMPTPRVQLVHAFDDGVALLAAAAANGFDGVVGKRMDGRYEAGKRSPSWIHVKGRSGKGVSRGKTLARDGLDSRLRGNDGGKTLARDELDSRLRGNDRGKTLARDGLDSRLRGNDSGDVVAQLDGAKKDFTLAVDGQRIKLTNLDRIYWPANEALRQPAVTKRGLLRYLAQVAPFMLPHLADRPLTMIRMPDGITGQRFFQKHWESERPAFVDAITVFSGHKDESHEYLVCNNLPTLLWLAQSGTLEFHVWHSRARLGADAPDAPTDYATSLESLEASILNYPDYVLFDIDPYIYSGKEAKGAEPELNTIAFEKGKEVAFHLREVLQAMKLEPIVKTSGKTGLHVFVPIRRTLDFDAARHVSELVGRHLVSLFPKDVTVEWSVPKRTGKIFMDYNMNVRGKTLNVAYSPRGEAGAPVSMPLTWEELANAHPLDFRMTNAAERLAATGDRWREALKRKQNLEAALKKAGR